MYHVYGMYCRSNVNNAFRTIHKCTKHFKDILSCFDVATEIKKQIEDFKPFIPLIQGLRNQGIRNRHWEQVCVFVCVWVCMYFCVPVYMCILCLYIRTYVCTCILYNIYVHIRIIYINSMYVHSYIYTCIDT